MFTLLIKSNQNKALLVTLAQQMAWFWSEILFVWLMGDKESKYAFRFK